MISSAVNRLIRFRTRLGRSKSIKSGPHSLLNPKEMWRRGSEVPIEMGSVRQPLCIGANVQHGDSGRILQASNQLKKKGGGGFPCGVKV